ncbi:hypothetical protein QMT40_001899 [Parvibaculaceae bacterium PLY_AMNH_Bact1]|nr:hypothetical protein QMT40_001899 [Parvibaculaceae bacterium PLY_AMNH_Bact1]
MSKAWPKLRASLIRQAANQSLDHSARLSSVADCSNSRGVHASQTRALTMAATDLISFSVHLRRLIELTEVWNSAKAVTVPFWLPPSTDAQQTESIPLWDLLNAILHSRHMDIMTHEAEFRVTYLGEDFDWEAAFESIRTKNSGEIPTFVLVQSDRQKAFVFGLLELIRSYEKFIQQVVERCAENGLDLCDDIPEFF